MQIQKLFVVIASAVAALTLVGCGAESAATVTPVAKVTQTALAPFNANDGVVVGEMLQLNCGKGMTAIELPAQRSAEKVGETDVRYSSAKYFPSGVTYEFSGPLPEVQAVIVSFLKKPSYVNQGWASQFPTALDYRAMWPESASAEPAKLLVQSSPFSEDKMDIGSIKLCVA